MLGSVNGCIVQDEIDPLRPVVRTIIGAVLTGSSEDDVLRLMQTAITLRIQPFTAALASIREAVEQRALPGSVPRVEHIETPEQEAEALVRAIHRIATR